MKKTYLPLLFILIILSFYFSDPVMVNGTPPNHDSITIAQTHDRDVGDDMNSTITRTITRTIYGRSQDTVVSVRTSDGYFSGVVSFDSVGSATDTTMSTVDTGYVKLLYRLGIVNRNGTRKTMSQWKTAQFYDSTAGAWIDSVRWLTAAGIENTTKYEVRFPDVAWCDWLEFTNDYNDSNAYTFNTLLDLVY